MRVLYIFPHPDDESFGPSGAINKQVREGHEVYLLTLTKGGATKIRFDLGLSVEEMGEVRYREMQNVSRVLGLSGMNVMDLPDSGLKLLDPRIIEEAVSAEIERLKPDVVVTYAVHGISGFQDHLVTHAAVKRVFCEMRDSSVYPKRLCLLTVDKETSDMQKHFKLSYSSEEEIGCKIRLSEQDIEKAMEALDCYISYEKTINESGIRNILHKDVCFELFQENHGEVLTDIFENLNN